MGGKDNKRAAAPSIRATARNVCVYPSPCTPLSTVSPVPVDNGACPYLKMSVHRWLAGSPRYVRLASPSAGRDSLHTVANGNKLCHMTFCNSPRCNVSLLCSVIIQREQQKTGAGGRLTAPRRTFRSRRCVLQQLCSVLNEDRGD